MNWNFWNKKPASGPPQKDEKRGITLIRPQNPNRLLGIDLKTWWDAVVRTMDVYSPSWYALQDVYMKVMYDGRLKGVIDKRRLALLNLDLVYKDANGERIEEVCKFIKTPEYRKFLSAVIDTIFYGWTTIQVVNDKGKFTYDLLPREHINPKDKELLINKTDFRGKPLADYPGMFLFTVDGLGLLAVVAQYAIYKRNGFADYGQYVERFAMPIEAVTYEGNDPNLRQQIQNGLDNRGSGAQVEIPKGVTLDVKNSASSSNNDLFTQFIEANNSEMTIAILGQLMTTEKGANYQAQVQSNVEESIFSADRVWLLDVLNYSVRGVLLPMFNLPADGEFMFEDTERKDRKELIAEDTALNQLIPLDKSALYEKYGEKMPVTVPTTEGV